MTVTLREPTVSDFYALTEYYQRFFDEVKENPELGLTLADEKPTTLDNMKWFQEFMKSYEEGNAVGALALDGDEVVGFCEVTRNRPRSNVAHRGALGISVRKGYRGKGIGKRLLGETIKRCRGKFEILELDVFTVNKAALHIYEKFGFKTIGVLPRAVKRKGKYYDEAFMYLKL